MSQPEYISKEGATRLGAELDKLLTSERPMVVNQVATAAAEGDRSENAEYIYGKKRLRQIDKRIEFLSRRLDTLEIVPAPRQIDKVVFLSWVVVEDEEGSALTFRIVGRDETDAGQGLISWRAPVGRALLGAHLDDTVTVHTPKGRRVLTVVQIARERPADG